VKKARIPGSNPGVLGIVGQKCEEYLVKTEKEPLVKRGENKKSMVSGSQDKSSFWEGRSWLICH
jgi:hypothetical protein